MDFSSSCLKHVLITCIHILAFSMLSFSVDQKTYIVKVDDELKPAVFPTLNHWYESSLIGPLSSSEQVTEVGASGRIIYTYDTVLHGFSAKLSAEEARKLEKTNGVLSVVPEQVRHLQTTRTPEFLGLKRTGNGGLLKESDYGSNVIIGVIDLGIWPERESFHDRGLGPVPSRWKGQCVVEDDFPASLCNRKLIGARYFVRGYEAEHGKLNQTSPRDYNGHGTSSASIAAGRYVSSASFFGYAQGVAAGMAPKARLAIYKTCWDGCRDSDILAAFEAAISDGVDIISISLSSGGVSPYYYDSMAIGAFAATEAGILVSVCAGNNGPGDGTVTNVAPWFTTVGAGSIDRDFPAEIKLGNGKEIQGLSVYSGPGLETNKFYPLFYAGNFSEPYDTPICEQSFLNPDEVKGKIVICYPGMSSDVEKGEFVKNAGGVGMILANRFDNNSSLDANYHVLPTVSVNAGSAEEIRKYILAASQKDSSPTGTLRFQGTKLGVKPAPVIASFSSRGPNPGTPEILKPDLIAPGSNILVASTGSGPSDGIPSYDWRTGFTIKSGTSIACPHVSGIAAMLKGVHPKWSPAAIRSALITTAYTVDNTNEAIIDEWTGNHATVMEFGAGHVNPQQAMNPGLIYDLTSQDYVAFLCNMNYTENQILTITKKYKSCSGVNKSGNVRNFNYPSLSAVFKQRGKAKMTAHFDRTVTNVGDPDSVYTVTVSAPGGTSVIVKPNRLAFQSVGEKLSFHVRVETEAVQLPLERSSIVKSGYIVWSDGKHVVTSPLVIIMK